MKKEPKSLHLLSPKVSVWFLIRKISAEDEISNFMEMSISRNFPSVNSPEMILPTAASKDKKIVQEFSQYSFKTLPSYCIAQEGL